MGRLDYHQLHLQRTTTRPELSALQNPTESTALSEKDEGGKKSNFNTQQELTCQEELFIGLVLGKSFCPCKSFVPLEIY